ncbi:hypothetical protein Tco_1536995 [Tanacetum coccineum]
MCVVNILSSVNATPTVKIILNKGKQIWKPKGKLSDNSLNKTKQVWKATGKLFANVGYQWRSTGKKVALGKLNCGYQWRPTGKIFTLGELCPLTKLFVQSSIITANQQDPNTNWGSKISNPPNSTIFKCRWRLLASLQAPFLKEKKGVRFSALYLQQKRNLLVLDHSHQQVSYFFHARSVVRWINVHQLIRKGNLLLDLQKLQKRKPSLGSIEVAKESYLPHFS